MITVVGSALLNAPLLLFSSQGVFIFFFHVIFNNEVRKNLKNIFTGKKSVPDESSTTRASLLTVSYMSDSYASFIHFFQSNESLIYFVRPPPPIRQRSLNCNNTNTEDGQLYRSGIGESTVSLDSTLRSAKSRSSFLAYTLRYNTLTDCTAASNTLLCMCVCVGACKLFVSVLLVVFRCSPHTY